MWFKKAAEQNVTHMKELYGTFPRSPAQAIIHAQYQLGWMYNYGKGIPFNREKAIEWYRKSVENGYPKAQSQLAYLEKSAPKQNSAQKKPLQNNIANKAVAGLVKAEQNYSAPDVTKADWVFIDKSKDGTLYIDAESIEEHAPYKKAWFKIILNQARTFSMGGQYNTVFNLEFYSCKENKRALAAIRAYDEKGKYVTGVDKNVSNLDFINIKPNTTAETQQKLVCSSSKEIIKVYKEILKESGIPR